MLVIILRLLRFAPRLFWRPLFGIWRGAKFACLAFADRILEGVHNGLKFLAPPAPVAEPAWHLSILEELPLGEILAATLTVSTAVMVISQAMRLKKSRKEVANLKLKLEKLEQEVSAHENIENRPPSLIADNKVKRNPNHPSSPKRRSAIAPLVESPFLDNVKRGGFLKDYWRSA